MRGQLFTLDAVVALWLLFTSMFLLGAAGHGVLDAVSEDLLYRRWEVTVNHAVSTLLLGDGAWACKVNGIRVPGCVLTTAPPSHDSFFLNDVNCYLEGDSTVANILGCTDAPSNALISYTVSFPVCVGTSPSSCTVKTLRLTIWKGR